VQLRGVVGGAEAGPAGERRKPDRGRVDEAERVTRAVGKARLELVQQARQDRLVERERALGVGLGEGAAADRSEAQVVGVVGVAGERGDQLAQRRDPGELGVEEGDELAPRGQDAHPAIGGGALGEVLKAPPWHRLAEVVEERIVMVHGQVRHVLSQHLVHQVETSTKPGHAPPPLRPGTGQPWA
jgi:hypothetical protein